jgi:hypothetical protein
LPHTGVVNLFIAADPFIAVGSVSEGAAPNRYDWHCFLDDPANGAAPEMIIAEAQLKAAIASRRRRPVSISLTTNPSDRLEA